MICQNLVRFSLLLVLLLGLSSALYSDVILTDAEAAEISRLAEESRTISIAQLVELQRLGTLLRTSRSSLIQAQISLITSQMDLEQSRAIAVELATSYRTQKTVTIIIAILSAVSAAALGYVIGAF